jgi:hypothetical protein
MQMALQHVMMQSLGVMPREPVIEVLNSISLQRSRILKSRMDESLQSKPIAAESLVGQSFKQ